MTSRTIVIPGGNSGIGYRAAGELVRMTFPIQVGNQHYAAHLARTEPGLLAGCVNAGVARTGIWRKTPWYTRIFISLIGPFIFDPIERSAANPVAASVRDGWPSGTYWEKVGDFERQTPIALDEPTTARIMEGCRALTGV